MIKTLFDGHEIKIVEDAPKPKIENENDILIKVHNASLCGTDLHILSGGLPLKRLPLTLGHEYSGVVVDVGKSVSKFKVGDRVFGSPFIPCGNCFYCKIGKSQLCENRINVGISIDGSFQEYLLLPNGENCLHHLSDDLSFEIGSILGDMVSTSAYAVERGNIKDGDFVVILGLGPIGLSAIPFVRAKGANTIVGVTRSSHKLEFAKSIGADYAISPMNVNLSDFIKSKTNGLGADVVIETASVQETIEQALKIVRKAGRISTIGVYEKNVNIDMKKLVLHELDLVGSLDPVDDLWISNMMKIIENNKIDFSKFITHKFGIKDINHAFEVFKNKKENCIKVVISIE